MRVLISTRPGSGHVGPLIPFAHALLRNNDEVIVTAPAQAASMISEAGLDHHPIPDPPAEDREPIFAKAKTLDPDAANALVGADLFVRIDTRTEALDEVRAEIGLEADPQLERIAETPSFSLIPEALEVPVVVPFIADQATG
jgi:UDP:flavonoid glycosyltransferase YjiC (YdhE family)